MIDDNDKVISINTQILIQCMQLLYETHIEDTEIAQLRGYAIQAIDKMLKHFGYEDAIADNRKKPFSQRRRESEIWNEEEEN